MSKFHCPICQEEVTGDFIKYIQHGQTHVIDEIKKSHPSWIEADGVCHKCEEYFRKQMEGPQ